MNKKSIDLLAKQLLIELSPDENALVLNDFTFIESNMNLINNIPGIEKIAPMTHPFDLYETTLSADVAAPSIPVQDLLHNSDKTMDREIEVPKVVG